MSASKRDFTDFKKFGGSINEKTGHYVFPILKHVDANGNEREWQIFVRLIKKPKKVIVSIAWELSDETQVRIRSKYFNYGENSVLLPENIVAEVWVETGIIGMTTTRYAPTYIYDGVLHGRANQRNKFQQALILARTQYLKQKDRGKHTKGFSKSNKINVRYFPMLARVEEGNMKYIKFPCIVQPKLDGIRCLVYLERVDSDWKSVIVYSRQRNDFENMDHMKMLLYPLLNEMFDRNTGQSLYLDGELYKHGDSLQKLSGRSRRSNKAMLKDRSDDDDDDDDDDTKESNKLPKLKEINEYHIYDCFYPCDMDMPFKTRLRLLRGIFKMIDKGEINKQLGYSASDVCKLVPYWKVHELSEGNKLFKTLTKEGYEGIMFRNRKGEYLADSNQTGTKLRSKDLIKKKQRHSDEFNCVGFTEGKRGKAVGAIIWIAETDKGLRFNATPKGITDEERYELYKDALKNFDKKYKDKPLTIEYEALSNAGKPLRAKAVGFRDYE